MQHWMSALDFLFRIDTTRSYAWKFDDYIKKFKKLKLKKTSFSNIATALIDALFLWVLSLLQRVDYVTCLKKLKKRPITRTQLEIDLILRSIVHISVYSSICVTNEPTASWKDMVLKIYLQQCKVVHLIKQTLLTWSSHYQS